MSSGILYLEQLVAIESPYVEPRLAHQGHEPRKVNNLTLIDGKTFLATNVAGDIVPPGAPDVGFFHEDTRFLSHLEFKLDGHRSAVLSSSTEKTFVSQIELTTGNITLRDSFDLPENTVHIRREQLLASDILFDRFTFENFNRCRSSIHGGDLPTMLILWTSFRCAEWLAPNMDSITSHWLKAMG